MLFSASEKVLNSFKSRLFPIKNLNNILTRELIPELATQPATKLEVATKATEAKDKRKIS